MMRAMQKKKKEAGSDDLINADSEQEESEKKAGLKENVRNSNEHNIEEEC
jgi:hypothetical protein